MAEGKRRLEGLRPEAAAQPAPQPVIPGTDELTHLWSHVAQLEGDLRQSHQFATEKISAETSPKTTSRASVARGGSIEGSCAFSSFWFHRDGVGANRQVKISVDIRVDRRGRQETPPSEWRTCTVKKCKSTCVSRDVRCGLRVVRVGEASHTGPGSRLRRTQRLRSVAKINGQGRRVGFGAESVVSAPVSVDAAQEEHTVPSTIPASDVLRVAVLVEVIPMFDGCADGSEHEVDAATVGRRRLVLVSQGSHVSKSGEGKLEDDKFPDDDSIYGVSVVSDVSVVLGVSSPLPIDLDPRRRIIAANFGLLDEVCLKDCRAHVSRVVPFVGAMRLENLWLNVLREGQGCCSEAHRRSVRRRRRNVDELEVRASRALHLCQEGPIELRMDGV